MLLGALHSLVESLSHRNHFAPSSNNIFYSWRSKHPPENAHVYYYYAAATPCALLVAAATYMSLGFTSVRTRLRKVTGTYWKERGHAERLWRLAPDGTFDAPDDTVGELLGVILRGISATMTSSEILLWGVTHPSALHPAGHLSLVHGDFGTKYSLETQEGSTFTSNAPRVFGRIRQAYGVSESLFSESMQSLHAGLLSQSKAKAVPYFCTRPMDILSSRRCHLTSAIRSCDFCPLTLYTC